MQSVYETDGKFAARCGDWPKVSKLGLPGQVAEDYCVSLPARSRGMRQWSFVEIVVWTAFALWASPIAFAQEVKVDSATRGMVLISGGEFLLGAATNGHGSDEITMPSKYAEQVSQKG